MSKKEWSGMCRSQIPRRRFLDLPTGLLPSPLGTVLLPSRPRGSHVWPRQLLLELGIERMRLNKSKAAWWLNYLLNYLDLIAFCFKVYMHDIGIRAKARSVFVWSRFCPKNMYNLYEMIEFSKKKRNAFQPPFSVRSNAARVRHFVLVSLEWLVSNPPRITADRGRVDGGWRENSVIDPNTTRFLSQSNSLQTRIVAHVWGRRTGSSRAKLKPDASVSAAVDRLCSNGKSQGSS